MTELLLDNRHWDTFHHQLVGMSVAEPMGMDPLINPRFGGKSREKSAHIGRLQRLASERAEQCCSAVNAELLALSTHRITIAIAPGFIPTVLRRSPFPCSTVIVPSSESRSLGLRARASLRRNPPR